jgi:predicted dehydrogenase
MLAQGSHLLDTARFLAGDIVEVAARFSERGGMRCWFVDVTFASGAIGHLDLTVAVRMDWHEGFQIYGRNGSVLGKTFNPWLYKASEVDIFRESDGAYHRVLGADAHFYRRQLEAFADSVISGGGHGAADIDDGVASVRAMVAIGQSIDTGKPVRLADACGPVG